MAMLRSSNDPLVRFVSSRFFPEHVSALFKLYCLAVMTLVAAAYTVALRYTRTTPSGDLYFSTTAVCITEVVKLILSLGMLIK